MKRINFHITENHLSALKEIKERTGVSGAEIIRRALDKFFFAERKVLNKPYKKEVQKNVKI